MHDESEIPLCFGHRSVLLDVGVGRPVGRMPGRTARKDGVLLPGQVGCVLLDDRFALRVGGQVLPLVRVFAQVIERP